MNMAPFNRRSFLARVVGGAAIGGGGLALARGILAQPPQPQQQEAPPPGESPPGSARCPESAVGTSPPESEQERIAREYREAFSGCETSTEGGTPATRGFSLSREGLREQRPAGTARSVGRFRPCRSDSDAGASADPRCKR